MQLTTRQQDTWDKISYRLYNNEYYGDQLQNANQQYMYVTEFDAGVVLQVPTVLAPLSISSTVWGGVVRYA